MHGDYSGGSTSIGEMEASLSRTSFSGNYLLLTSRVSFLFTTVCLGFFELVPHVNASST